MFVANRIMKGRSEKVQDHNDHEENETHTTEVHSAVLVCFLSGVTLQSLSIRSDMVRSHIDGIVEFMEDLILLLDFVSHHVGMVLVIECSAMQPSVQLALHSSLPRWCRSVACSFHRFEATPSASPSSPPRRIQ